jgi:hypothetical protein
VIHARKPMRFGESGELSCATAAAAQPTCAGGGPGAGLARN